MAIVAAIASICYIGIKQSASFNSVIVTIKVTVIVLFILFGVRLHQQRELASVRAAERGNLGHFRSERRAGSRRSHLLRLYRF